MRFYGTAHAIKRHRRLHIEVKETGAHLYTPPDFVHVSSRLPMQHLADAMTARQCCDIELIMAFEDRWKRRTGVR